MLFSITPSALAQEVKEAKESVYYIGSGIDEPVAHSIIRARTNNPALDICVVIDCDAQARRLGYGDQTSIGLLMEADIEVHQLPNVRISACIVDDRGWIFAVVPKLIEDPQAQFGLNGVELNRSQIWDLTEQIINLVRRDLTAAELMNNGQESSLSLSPILPSSVSQLTEHQLGIIDDELEENPPQRFDISRQLNVFNSRIEFVELEFEGGNIERHTFKLPPDIIKLLASDRDAQARLSANYKLIGENSKTSSKELMQRVQDLRANYLRPMGKLGRVILRSQKENFERDLNETRRYIEEFKKTMLSDLSCEIESSVESLHRELVPRLIQTPTKAFVTQVEHPITEEKAQRYLQQVLSKSMPNVEKLVSDISLRSEYKAVTYEMLSSEAFQNQVREAFPCVDWAEPMEEFEAIRTV